MIEFADLPSDLFPIITLHLNKTDRYNFIRTGIIKNAQDRYEIYSQNYFKYSKIKDKKYLNNYVINLYLDKNISLKTYFRNIEFKHNSHQSA